MFYSRFDEAAGVYDVFQDNAQRAVNADLPVPDMPAELNGIGAPASECGRPLPNGAVHVGQTWSPKGIIVTPKPRVAMSGLGDASTLTTNMLSWASLSLVLTGALMYSYGSDKNKTLAKVVTAAGIGTGFWAWWA